MFFFSFSWPILLTEWQPNESTSSTKTKFTKRKRTEWLGSENCFFVDNISFLNIRPVSVGRYRSESLTSTKRKYDCKHNLNRYRTQKKAKTNKNKNTLTLRHGTDGPSENYCDITIYFTAWKHTSKEEKKKKRRSRTVNTIVIISPIQQRKNNNNNSDKQLPAIDRTSTTIEIDSYNTLAVHLQMFY